MIILCYGDAHKNFIAQEAWILLPLWKKKLAFPCPDTIGAHCLHLEWNIKYSFFFLQVILAVTYYFRYMELFQTVWRGIIEHVSLWTDD